MRLKVSAGEAAEGTPSRISLSPVRVALRTSVQKKKNLSGLCPQSTHVLICFFTDVVHPFHLDAAWSEVYARRPPIFPKGNCYGSLLPFSSLDKRNVYREGMIMFIKRLFLPHSSSLQASEIYS